MWRRVDSSVDTVDGSTNGPCIVGKGGSCQAEQEETNSCAPDTHSLTECIGQARAALLEHWVTAAKGVDAKVAVPSRPIMGKSDW